MDKARKEFIAKRCDDKQTEDLMRVCYAETGYLLDPHTAVGLFASLQVRQDPAIPIISLACAHPSKFPDAVESAVGFRPELPEHLADLYDREEFVTPLPNKLATVQDFVRKNVK
jgi:threonine synthase